MKPIKPVKMPQFDFLIKVLNSRSNREKQVIIGLLIAAVFFVDYTLLIRPSVETFSQMLPKLSPLKRELKDLREDKKSKEEIAKKWQDSQQLLTEHSRALISPDETPALLENLSQMAQKAGVQIISLQPSDESKSGGKALYTSFPIMMKGMAGTHEFGAFLASLESGATFFSIQDLKITTNQADDRKHLVEVWMEAYKQEK